MAGFREPEGSRIAGKESGTVEQVKSSICGMRCKGERRASSGCRGGNLPLNSVYGGLFGSALLLTLSLDGYCKYEQAREKVVR